MHTDRFDLEHVQHTHHLSHSKKVKSCKEKIFVEQCSVSTMKVLLYANRMQMDIGNAPSIDSAKHIDYVAKDNNLCQIY